MHAGDFCYCEDPLFLGLCFGLYVLFRYFYLHLIIQTVMTPPMGDLGE